MTKQRGRTKKGAKIEKTGENTAKTDRSGVEKEETPITKPEFLAKKDQFRIDEIADYFSVHPRTIRNWIDHGHLWTMKSQTGIVYIPREAVLSCRLGFTALKRQGIVVGPLL